MNKMKRRQILMKALQGGLVSATVPLSLFSHWVKAQNQPAKTLPKQHFVEIATFAFLPEVLVVNVGDTVTWTNRDIVPHTATSLPGLWDTGFIESGGSISLRVTAQMFDATQGENYYCEYHPQMRARLSRRE